MAKADSSSNAATSEASSQLLLSMDDFKHFKQIGKGK
jgi:hypothetical protein